MSTPITARFVGGPLDGQIRVLPDAPLVYEAMIRRSVGNPDYGAYVMHRLIYERMPGSHTYWFESERHVSTA